MLRENCIIDYFAEIRYNVRIRVKGVNKMVVSVLRPELLTITDEKTDRSFFGGIQDWYASEWSRRAGCGPTCAANILAYLALTRSHYKPLYGSEKMNLSGFSEHMEAIYKYVTPGNMGLNRVEIYTEGAEAFAVSRGVSLTSHVFNVSSNRDKARPPVSELIEFVNNGLNADCPLAFLNLTRGREKTLQSWHWITVTSADIEDGSIIAEASDEGKLIRFDLRLWYLSTRMRGGLVYFT
jgi:hypothetical protein